MYRSNVEPERDEHSTNTGVVTLVEGMWVGGLLRLRCSETKRVIIGIFRKFGNKADRRNHDGYRKYIDGK